MNFNDHSRIKGAHALLGGSNYHWLNYDEDKLVQVFITAVLAKERGTELHALAEMCIRLNQKLPKSAKTLNRYVNDAIAFKMTPEVVLFYSNNAFGTADAISFRDNTLRIHDLKTGATQAHMEQLQIYAALFCLEYHIKPIDIHFVLRIYQNDDFTEYEPDPADISAIMKKIIDFDKILNDISRE